tara:strand:+ start:4109 stop:5050 length:942 start_codon:yes stop_codon:yes gene_type:complete
MGSSSRVLSGSLTKGSTAINIGDESATVDMSLFKQGHNIHTINDLSSGVSMKIRSHAGIKRVLDDKALSSKYFDDTLSPIFLSGSSAEISSPSAAGRFSYRVVHDREKRDLGQTDFYDDNEIFSELNNPDNPLHVIEIVQRGKKLPASLVDNSSISNFDGKIDPLGLFKSIDRSSTDFPFSSRGVRGNLGQNQDFLNRSSELEERKVLPGKKMISTSFYMDTPENFGNVLMLSVMNFNDILIKPFKDVSDDVEAYLDESGKFTDEGNNDIKNVLMSASFTVDDSRGTFDRMSVGGFDYEDGKTDSILFGGLKR